MPAFAGETRMDLLLWRHAEAEEGEIDFDRALTARGEKQAKAMSKWILQYQPKQLRIIASPTVRSKRLRVVGFRIVVVITRLELKFRLTA